MKPIITRGPLATTFRCPSCGYVEIGRKSVKYDCTRAAGRIRTHITKCLKSGEAVDVFEAFDMDLSSLTPGPSYWRGAIRRNMRTVARTDRHETREAAEREVAELLKQFTP